MTGVVVGGDTLAPNKNIRLTRYELELMEVLWQLGSASVREVRENLPTKKRPAYTTIQTMVYRLEEKGALRRVKKIGNAHIFEPEISRKATHRRLIDELLELLGGSARPLMAHLVETGKLTLDDIRQMEQELKRLGRKKTRSSGRSRPKGDRS